MIKRPFISKGHMDIDQETAEKLLSIVKELCSINAYEYPYRVPALQELADDVLEAVEE